MDELGKVVIIPQFDEAHDFSDGMGFIDKTGRPAFEKHYIDADDFS